MAGGIQRKAGAWVQLQPRAPKRTCNAPTPITKVSLITLVKRHIHLIFYEKNKNHQIIHAIGYTCSITLSFVFHLYFPLNIKQISHNNTLGKVFARIK